LDEMMNYKKIIVTDKGPRGGDGGIDLNMYMEGDRLDAIGQCKLWSTRYKGLINTIRELKGCMDPGIEKAFLIITVEANDYEKREAKRRGIEIIDAPALDRLISEYHEKIKTSQQTKITIRKRKIIPTLLKWFFGVTVFLLVLPVMIVILPYIVGFMILMCIIGLAANSATTESTEDSGGYNPRYHRRRSYRRRKTSRAYHSSGYRRSNYYSSYRGLRGGWGR
jgi:hypothetical protein